MRKTKKITFALSFIIFGVFVLVYGSNLVLGENMDSVAVIKSKAMLNELIQKTVEDAMAGQNQNELFVITCNKDKEIRAVSVDTAKMNSIIFNVTSILQEQFSDFEAKSVKLPLGSLLGSKLLTQTNLYMNVKILPAALIKCEYETSFETQGINQTKYEIYLNIESDVKILRPFSNKTYKIKSRVLAAQIILLGDVPGNYVNVPKEDILDAT